MSTGLAMTEQRPVAAAGPYTIALSTAYGCGTKAVADIGTWVASLGWTLKVTSGPINATFLSDVDALLLGSPYGPVSGLEEFNSTNWPAYYTPIVDWFATGGGKFLWVGSDGDYQGRNWIAENGSAILAGVGSAIRIEPADISELALLGWDDGYADYRLIVNVTASNAVSQFCFDGVNATLFHGPTCLYGISGGAAVSLEDVAIPNVYPIGLEHAQSKYEPDDPTVPGYAHTIGEAGPFVMIAGQVGLGPAYDNKVMACGASMYGDYEPIWKDSYHGLAMNGSGFVKNCILWGLTYEAFPPGLDPLLIIAVVAIVIVIVVIVIIVLLLRRRK